MVSETKSTYVECLCSKDCFPLNSPPHGIYKEAILVTTPCCLLKQSDISSAVSGYCSKGISNESSVFMKIIIFVIIVNLMIKLGKGVPKKGGWSYKTWTICFFFFTSTVVMKFYFHAWKIDFQSSLAYFKKYSWILGLIFASCFNPSKWNLY